MEIHHRRFVNFQEIDGNAAISRQYALGIALLPAAMMLSVPVPF